MWHCEDPEGLFYYEEASDMSGDAKAKVLKVVWNGTKYIHIKFYTDFEDQTYAEVGRALFLSLLSLTLASVHRRRPRTRVLPSSLRGLTKNLCLIAGWNG